MNWFKKIFGKKEKPKDKSHIPEYFTLEERKISPLLTNDDKQSVPFEEKNIEGYEMDFIHLPIPNQEEPIAPTLQVYDDEELEKMIKEVIPDNSEVVKKTQDDLLFYGVSITKTNEDGTQERINPESEEAFRLMEKAKERQDEIKEEKKPARKVNLSKPVVDLMNEMSEGEKYFKENIEKINEDYLSIRGIAMKEIEKTKSELDKEDWLPIPKNKKPKKQAKKKDNRNPDDDRKSWPNSNNFTL